MTTVDGGAAAGDAEGAGAAPVGRVAHLARFPVKSMLGEEPDEVELGVAGVVGDRALAVIDRATGLVASAKRPSRWGALLQMRARYVDPPGREGPLPPVEVTLADGTTVRSDVPGADDVLSRSLGREVALAPAPEHARLEQVWPRVEGSVPEGFVEGVAVDDDAGEPMTRLEFALFVPPGSLLDVAPLHLVTTATLDRLAELAPGVDLSWRRFRPNVVVDVGGDGGFVEDAWVDVPVTLGPATARGVLPTMRCVMTTLAHGDLPADRGLLGALASHHRVEVAGTGSWACAGLYAAVDRPGLVRVGDPVSAP